MHQYVDAACNTYSQNSKCQLLMHKGSDPERKRVLLLAPAGVAAVNIDGTTFHSGLGIFQKYYTPLSDKLKGN